MHKNTVLLDGKNYPKYLCKTYDSCQDPIDTTETQTVYIVYKIINKIIHINKIFFTNHNWIVKISVNWRMLEFSVNLEKLWDVTLSGQTS